MDESFGPHGKWFGRAKGYSKPSQTFAVFVRNGYENRCLFTGFKRS